MNKITSEMVAELFTTENEGEHNERIIYNVKYLCAPSKTVEHDLYQIVSNYAHSTTLSYGFSYEVVSRACSILADLPIYNASEMPDNDDGIHEAVDNAVPGYNWELVKIYAQDWDKVDDTREVWGEGNSIEMAQYAWYALIDVAVREIGEAITNYNAGK